MFSRVMLRYVVRGVGLKTETWPPPKPLVTARRRQDLRRTYLGQFCPTTGAAAMSTPPPPTHTHEYLLEHEDASRRDEIGKLVDGAFVDRPVDFA